MPTWSSHAEPRGTSFAFTAVRFMMGLSKEERRISVDAWFGTALDDVGPLKR